MSTLLKIDVSPRGEFSISRKLSAEYAQQWLKSHPDGTIIDRDLTRTALPFVDVPWIAAAYSTPDQHTPEQQAAIRISDALIAELLAADEIVLATPMYNYNVPALLKAWIDHVVRLGKTFNSSYQGLVTGRKTTIILTSGSIYTPDSPMASFDAQSGYLKQVLGFIGITDPTILLVGGTSAVDTGKTKREEFLAPFEAQVAALAS